MRSSWVLMAGLALMAMFVGCSGKVDDTAVGGDGGDGGDGGEDGAETGGSGDAGGDSGGDPGGDSGGDSGGEDGGSSASGTDEGSDDDDLPVAEILDVFCTVQVSGDTRAVWTVLGTASDPQGADTLEPLVMDGIAVLQGGTEMARHPLSCAVVDLSIAECSGTFAGFGDGTSCEGAESYSVFIEAEDEDGNRGASASLAGRVAE